MKDWVWIVIVVAGTLVGVPVSLAACDALTGCTPAERQAVLSAEEALCTVPRALRGDVAEDIAIGCKVALPVSSALVQAAGDAGKN